jgi:hypothetical protein
MYPDKSPSRCGVADLDPVVTFLATPCPGYTDDIILNAVFHALDFQTAQTAIISGAFMGQTILSCCHGSTLLFFQCVTVQTLDTVASLEQSTGLTVKPGFPAVGVSLPVAGLFQF